MREDRLAAAFLTEIPSSDRSRFGKELGAEIEMAFDRGCAAFPDLRLDREVFAQHLARALVRKSDEASLSTLVAEDLYLACACHRKAPGAASALVSRYVAVIDGTVGRVVSAGLADEIAQGVLEDILVGSPTSPPEIGDYAGRAPLARWLEVIAQRAALRWLRTERRHAHVVGQAALEPSPASNTPAEVALFRAKYGRAFEEVLSEVLRAAPERDRTILRLHIVEGLSTERIGKMFGVNQSTAARRLMKARHNVLAQVKGTLKGRLNITSHEIESLGTLLEGRLDLSISEALTAAR
jgi:RNA polymerase sigma-70 factor (ECF subfamily)